MLINRREEALKADPRADRSELDKAVKKSARQDKKRWLLEGIGAEGSMQDKLKAVKNIKRDYAPDYYARVSSAGADIPFGHKAHATAQHLATKQ